jgi:hypothetical protein
LRDVRTGACSALDHSPIDLKRILSVVFDGFSYNATR